jgi:hypothetical protein
MIPTRLSAARLLHLRAMAGRVYTTPATRPTPEARLLQSQAIPPPQIPAILHPPIPASPHPPLQASPTRPLLLQAVVHGTSSLSLKVRATSHPHLPIWATAGRPLCLSVLVHPALPKARLQVMDIPIPIPVMATSPPGPPHLANSPKRLPLSCQRPLAQQRAWRPTPLVEHHIPARRRSHARPQPRHTLPAAVATAPSAAPHLSPARL